MSDDTLLPPPGKLPEKLGVLSHGVINAVMVVYDTKGVNPVFFETTLRESYVLKCLVARDDELETLAAALNNGVDPHKHIEQRRAAIRVAAGQSFQILDHHMRLVGEVIENAEVPKN